MEWVKYEKNYRTPIESWRADIEKTAMEQAVNLAMLLAVGCWRLTANS